MSENNELYQQVILSHNKSPKNYGKPDSHTHASEGFNPLCGDHYWIFLEVDQKGIIQDIRFEGAGCAISKASLSMMTEFLKGRNSTEVESLFNEFQALIRGELKPEKDPHHLDKLTIFSGVWQYPARIKCAILGWHTIRGALNQQEQVSTE